MNTVRLLTFFSFFLMTFCKAQNSIASQNKKDTLLQKRIGGIYATDFTKFEYAGTVAYSKSLSFKYGLDSFYYWQSSKLTGKGTYRINDDNTLTLFFENTKQHASLASRYVINDNNVPTADGSSKRRISLNFYDTEKHPMGASVKILSRTGKELLFTGASEVRKFEIDTADFPIRIKSILIESVPIFFTIAQPKNFHADLYFQANSGSTLCNGEIWNYEIIHLTHDLIELKKTGDEYFLKEEQQPKKFKFVSYIRM